MFVTPVAGECGFAIEMAVRSDVVLVFLTLASTGVLANDCERDSSSVFEASSCFCKLNYLVYRVINIIAYYNTDNKLNGKLYLVACSSCYKLVESFYNTTLEARVNFTKFHQHFLNISQLNISQLVSHYETMLIIHRGLATETAGNERNLTFHLSTIANATNQASELLDVLKRNLSLAINGDHSARTTHGNNMAVLMEVEELVNTISDIVSRNITSLSFRAEFIYNQILTKVSK